MIRSLITLCVLLLAVPASAEWRPMFNGKDLTGWSGDPRLWRVENGVIVGETNATDKKLKSNSFLIWEGGKPGDFEMQYQARVVGNNSGVQYRSKVLDADKWAVGGYQMDLHPKASYLGMLYEERGRGIACQRGQKVELDNKPKVTGKFEIEDVDLKEWNTYRIVARGHVLQHYVNGKLAAEIHDVNKEKRSAKGVIALQVHAGAPMKVEFKDLKIQMLDVGKAKEANVTLPYNVAPGFELERLYEVPKTQGSWVGITVDDDGIFYCCDQHGKIYRVSVEGDETAVEDLDIKLEGAHGVLWHRGVLWVSVNERPRQGGVWKVTDSDGDGKFDEPELVKAMKGRGEHGPHSLVPSPDGESIYFVAGNHVDLPEMKLSMVPYVWEEDQLLPRRPDARGHARTRMAPGGWVARFDLEGKNWELLSIGYRNAFDIAFNEHGDLFAYDSDMEWDLGMPWYRPTRLCHVVPGSEFGWRNGTGKWPEYYEDSMPPLLDIGPGSPTGLLSGRGAKFPAKYQRAIFGLDWTFATLYAFHLTPDGDSYKAESEEIVTGSGLPLADAVIGKDGAMYFVTGGRKIKSAMYRLSYTGDEPTDPVAFKSKEILVMSPNQAPEALGSPDREARFRARTIFEHAGPDSLNTVLSDSSSTPWQIITAAIGLARVGSADDVPGILDALDRLDWEKLDVQQKINWLRAAGLGFARHGEPTDSEREQVLSKIDDFYPAEDDDLNRELCRMLSYLQAPGVVARTLTLMDTAGPSPTPDWAELAKRNSRYGGTVEKMIANLPPEQVIHYVYCLRVVKGPWREDERRRFFNWITKLSSNSGGASYAGFIKDLRKETLDNCTPEERELIKTFDTAPPANPFANLPPVEGPGRAWTVDEVVQLAENGLEGADREHGEQMYRAVLCAACHRFGGEGGAAGPDLTNVAGRFSVRDLADAIHDPNKEVSDQYAFDEIKRKDGSVLNGKIVEKRDGKLVVATNPFDFSQTIEIDGKDVESIEPSPNSPMPTGLINRLNEEELRDLLAYLLKD